MLEMLKRLSDVEDLLDSPDLGPVCDYLGLDEDEDPDVIREAIELEIQALEGDEDDAEEGEEGGDANVE